MTLQVQPLAGIRVLDVSRLLPGAYCTLLLADLGAEVIKIEDPRGGDPVRAIGPFADGVSVYFAALNRDKRSVTLDLRQDAGKDLLYALAGRADVLVESFRPRTAERLGVSADAFRTRHPRLIHCAMTGFGRSGPYADKPAHDINFIALSGLLDPTWTTDEQARQASRMLIADTASAQNAVMGILAALFARERTGVGSAVEIAMHDAALAWLMLPAARGGTPDEREPGGLPLTGCEAYYNVYATADGRAVALGALEPKFWRTFCDRIGRPDMIARQHATGEAQEALKAEVSAIFLQRTRDAWLEFFEHDDVCLTPVNRVSEALADPQVEYRRTVVRSSGSAVIRSPLRFDPTSAGRDAAWAPRPAPVLGESTDALLDAAGFNRDAREALRARGVI